MSVSDNYEIKSGSGTGDITIAVAWYTSSPEVKCWGVRDSDGSVQTSLGFSVDGTNITVTDPFAGSAWKAYIERESDITQDLSSATVVSATNIINQLDPQAKWLQEARTRSKHSIRTTREVDPIPDPNDNIGKQLVAKSGGFEFVTLAQQGNLGCVLTADAGGVWSIVDDATYKPSGISSISQDSDKITLTYDSTWTSIATASVSTNSVLQGSFTVNPAPGLSSCDIYISDIRLFGGQIISIGATFAVNASGITNAVWSGDNLLVTFDNSVAEDLTQISSASALALPRMLNSASTTATIDFYDYTGSKISGGTVGPGIFIRSEAGNTALNPNSVTSTNYPGNKIFVYLKAG